MPALPYRTSQPPPGTAPWTSNSAVLNNILGPNTGNLTSSAANIVGQLLAGQPGTSQARSANAYYGAGSGMPGSELIRNRGFDLYNRQGEERQQRGIEDLLSMISGYSGPALQERGQNIQQDQFDQNYNLELEKFGFDKERYNNSPEGRRANNKGPNGTFRIPGVNYGGIPGISNIPYRKPSGQTYY